MLAVVATGSLLALAGCEAGPAPLEDAAVVPPDVAMPPPPDLAQKPPPAFCSKVACLPPQCCGNACKQPADCCPGTICLNGACAPQSCGGCGQLGCKIDLQKCTGQCADPPCCLAGCVDDSQCCPSTHCRVDVNGARRCMPDACDECGGFRPLCDVTAGSCATTCKPPASCGKGCANDNECGAYSVCNKTFLDGKARCVPAIFENTCNLCGPGGCVFHPSTCDVECAPAVMPDMAVAPDAAMSPDLAVTDLAPRSDGPAGDGGGLDGGADGGTDDGGDDMAPPDDLAVVVPDDLAPGPDLATPPPPPDLATPKSPECKGCCSPCANDGDCCGDQVCKEDRGHPGRFLCTPAFCNGCLYGCSFTCP